MSKLRIGLALFTAVAALGMAGCGGDDSSDGATKTTLPSEDGTDEDEYTDVLASSLAQGFDGTDADARCAAERAVDSIGADRLEAAGLTREVLESDDEEFAGFDLTKAESEALADALFECIDVTATFAEGFAAEGDTTDEEVACVSDAAATSDAFRSFIARSFRVGDTGVMNTPEAEEFAGYLLDCIDFGRGFAYEMGLDLTPDQQQCVSDRVRESDVFRDALVKELSGEPGPTESELSGELTPEIYECAPSDQLGDTPDASNA